MAVPNERPITVIPFITVPETVTLEPLEALNKDVRVWFAIKNMVLDQVDMVRLQPPQALLARAPDVEG